MLKSNLPESIFTGLHSLDRINGKDISLEPRFVIVVASCVQGKHVADRRQECCCEDILEDLRMEVLVLSVLIGTLTHCLSFLARKN